MKKIFILLLFIFINPVFAGNNLTFTCTDSSCEKSSNLPLFLETNIYPSYLVSQKTTIINNRSTNCNLDFKLANSQETDILSSVISVSSVGDTTVWYSGSLKSLFDNATHTLGQIPSNSTKEINWTASFNQDAGNEYQNISNLFNIDFNFTCDDPPLTPSNNIVNHDAPTCNDTVPTAPPVNFTATPGTNSVTLNWQKPTGTFTYYLIAFGDNQNADKYGNPNIGGTTTDSYIVNGLSSGKTYYFKIRTGNGCAPGPFSNIISVIPGGNIIQNPVIPVGFQPGVLGTQTTSPEVLGQQVATNLTCPWNNKYLIYFFVLILINIIFRYKKVFYSSLAITIFVLIYFLLRCYFLY
ncbi:MAG: fibronectin type III domain-containing protein [Candidatus Shapirobacteria bacterium]